MGKMRPINVEYFIRVTWPADSRARNKTLFLGFSVVIHVPFFRLQISYYHHPYPQSHSGSSEQACWRRLCCEPHQDSCLSSSSSTLSSPHFQVWGRGTRLGSHLLGRGAPPTWEMSHIHTGFRAPGTFVFRCSKDGRWDCSTQERWMPLPLSVLWENASQTQTFRASILNGCPGQWVRVGGLWTLDFLCCGWKPVQSNPIVLEFWGLCREPRASCLLF